MSLLLLPLSIIIALHKENIKVKGAAITESLTLARHDIIIFIYADRFHEPSDMRLLWYNCFRNQH